MHFVISWQTLRTRSTFLCCPQLLQVCRCHVIIPLPQNGATPLIIASQKGHSDVVTILLRNGAGVDVARNVSHLMISTSVSTCLTTIIVFNSYHHFYCLISLATIFISTHMSCHCHNVRILTASVDRQTNKLKERLTD